MNAKDIEKLGLRAFRGKTLGADDPARVAELEKLAGYSLPDDYREFLIAHAPSIIGGSVDFRPIEPSPWASKGLGHISVFLGLDKGDSDIVSENTGRDFPEGLITIGYDQGASNVLLSLEDPAGHVYFEDKDTGDLYLCARSFTDFIASFEEVPDE